MKKLVLIALLATSFGYSQLHVSNGSFLYVKNEQVFVGDFGDAAADINLLGTAGDYTQSNNGFIFLRNEGQLFQTTSGNSTPNTGLGKISIYQEGTANEYTFNYWSSPVQDPTSSLGTGFNTTVGFYDPDVDDLNPAVANLISGVNGNAFPLQIASFWIFTFTGDTGNVTANFEQIGSSAVTGEIIPPGFGFTMKGTNGTSSVNPGSAQQYDFRGRPNTGTIDVPVFLDRFTFVGNPYPSALDVQQFLLDPDNSETNGSAYFWQQAPAVSHSITDYVGGYGTYAPLTNIFVPATFTTFDQFGTPIGPDLGTGTTLPRQILPVAQGFFIFTTTDTSIDPLVDENVTFKNDYRVFIQESPTTSVFQGIEKEDDILISGINQQNSETSSNDINNNHQGAVTDYSLLRFRTAIGNDNLTKPMALSFFNGATDGFDRGADSPDISGLTNTVYWPIEDKAFIIQATNFEVDKEIPLAFSTTTESEFTVRITEKENFSQNILIFLLDRETGEYHNITDLPYTISLEEGTYESRFAITFRQIKEIDDDSSDDDIIAEDFGQNNTQPLQAFQNNVIKQLSILNTGGLNINTITMYDITGKTMFSDNLNSTNQTYTYGTGQYSTGIYIVSISVENGEDITTKVAINN